MMTSGCCCNLGEGQWWPDEAVMSEKKGSIYKIVTGLGAV